MLLENKNAVVYGGGGSIGGAATLEDVGNAAVFAASDWARSVTAAIINASAGALID
jgi:enoyl-[acyl-carrier-protein] reductase (NADH)